MSSSYRWTVLGLGFCACFLFYSSHLICITVNYFVFSVFSLWYCLVVSTGAIYCLERLVSEMTCYVSSWTLNHTHSVTHSGHDLLVMPITELFLQWNCRARWNRLIYWADVVWYTGWVKKVSSCDFCWCFSNACTFLMKFWTSVNPFTVDPVKALHFAILV